MRTPTLYIFSGLPASGKSTLAIKLARKLNATFVRIDTVEQGLRDLCNYKVEGEGYRLSYRIARDNLEIGNDVVADSVNPWELTRNEWNEVATTSGAKFVNIEMICSNENEHRDRVETRNVKIEGLKLPTWEEVKNRDYHEWTDPRIVIDTAGKAVDESLDQLISELKN